MAAVPVLSGCQTVGTIIDPLNVRALGKPPVRVGVTKLEFAPTLFFMPKWSLFNDGLANHLQEPVSFELMKPRQIRVHLGTGRLKFALLSPADYCEIAGEQNHEILAVPLNEKGQAYRRGLIIVAAKSPIHSLSELKTQRFHFLPQGDILNEAALGVLLEAGVAKADLDRGILGLELDTQHISSAEVVKSVVLEQKSAGVIDEADYNQWAKSGGIVLLPVPLPSQDQVRVIGRTVRVPQGPFVVSARSPAELTGKVRDYLLEVVPKNKLVVAPMGYTGFAAPIDPEEYEPFFAIHRQLHPPEAQGPTPEDFPADEPAQTVPAPH